MNMKAKQWAERLATSPVADLDVEFKSFIAEIDEIARGRGNALNAIEGAVREQRSKWAAVGRLLPQMAGVAFDDLLKLHGKVFQQAEADYRERLQKPKKNQGGKGKGRGPKNAMSRRRPAA